MPNPLETEEDKGGYHESINNWVRQWEEHAQFQQEIDTRHVIIRTGNVLHTDKGMLRYVKNNIQVYPNGQPIAIFRKRSSFLNSSFFLFFLSPD